MSEPVTCPRCNLRMRPIAYPHGTNLELDASPHPEGVWALKDGTAVCAVRFEPVPGKAPKPAGRLPGFANVPLYRAHYSTCAAAIAAKVDSRPKTGTR
jgi:hypothetical protein